MFIAHAVVKDFSAEKEPFLKACPKKLECGKERNAAIAPPVEFVHEKLKFSITDIPRAKP